MTARILRRASVVLASLVAVLVVGVLLAAWFVLASSSGARWALRTLSEHVPGLFVGRVEGSLSHGLVLGTVRYASGDVDVELGEVVLEPELASVLDGRLVLARLEIRGGSVNVPAANGPPPLPDIPEYLAIRSLRIADLAIDGVGSPLLVTSGVAALDGPRVTVASVEVRAGALALGGSGELTLTAGALRGSLEARLHGRDGTGAGEPPRLALSADVWVAAAADPWHAALRWTRLSWRGSPLGDLESPRGRLVVVPGAAPLTVELEADLQSAVVPDLESLRADASLSGDALDVGVAIRALGGQLAADGNLSVADLSGRFRVRGEGLDPARVDARLAGHIDGEVDVTFAAQPVPRLFADGTLQGELRGRSLQAELRGSWSERTLEIERGRVLRDDGSVEVTGRLTPESTSLRFAVDVPRVETWHPEVHGALVATGSVRGEPGNPAIAARIDARNFAFDGAPIPPVDELEVTVDGVLAAHTVRVRARNGMGSLRADARQRWDGESLRGSLVDSAIRPARAGTWTLVAPGEYSVGAAGGAFERLCYSGPERGLVCGALGNERLSVTAKRVPGRLAEPWLPPGVDLPGAADAELELDWRDTLQGSVRLHQPSLILHVSAPPDGGSDPVRVSPRSVKVVDIELQGVLVSERLRADIRAGFANGGDRVRAMLQVEPAHANGALSGHLFASLTDLTWLEALWDGVRDVHGIAEVDLSVRGTPTRPVVGGTMAMRSLRASVPPLGVEIENGHLSASAADPNELTFEGRLCTQGCLTFGGRVERPLQPGWRLDARLGGERVDIVDKRELRATVAPDLELLGDRAGWQLNGTLGVGEAEVVANTLPRAAVRPAAETIVHGGADRHRGAGGAAAPLALDIRARLGNVRFDGLGLTAELGGTLDLVRTASAPLLVHGTAEIEEGTFRIQWQEFEIERGLLIFTGPPENPSLDIRATREGEGGRVGVDITGTASNPVSEVFADSPMSDSEALAQLVTGRSLSDSLNEYDALERLARNLGLQQVSLALDRLRTGIGLDELGMDRSSPGNDALVAGERIGSDLLLCYRHGLFDDFTGLELVYGISDRFRLHTKSGAGQSIDLVYEIGPVDGPRPGCRGRGTRVR